MLAAAVVAAALCMAQTAGATVYNVGPGQSYTTIGAVPWESLNAGDTVNIYYSATPYREKFVLGRVGTLSQPITVHGVPGPSGQLPIIDGQNATTRLALATGSENRGIITDAALDNHPSIVQARLLGHRKPRNQEWLRPLHLHQ